MYEMHYFSLIRFHFLVQFSVLVPAISARGVILLVSGFQDLLIFNTDITKMALKSYVITSVSMPTLTYMYPHLQSTVNILYEYQTWGYTHDGQQFLLLVPFLPFKLLAHMTRTVDHDVKP